MKITFCGASRTVTGSCYLVENDGVKFLVDCGSFQGNDAELYNSREFPFNPSEIKFVILTHAHIDHSGRLPLLYKKGFKGKIYCTKATRQLSRIMLLDSAHIQEMEAEWGGKKFKRGTSRGYKPLYTAQDTEKCLKLFSSIAYDKTKVLNPNISFRLRDAGHLLGSAHIELWLTENGTQKKVVFSGDIGNSNQPLIKNPTPIDSADYIITESTYGDELHPKEGANATSLDRARRLADIIDATFQKGGNLVIPAFAVGRTQEILYFLHLIWKKKMLPYKVPTFVDSVMGIKATDIFAASVAECFDDEAKRIVLKGDNPLHFPSLLIAESSDESKKINEFPDPCVIISSSGMCDAGRIKHHLKYNIWREDSAILFTGYQAEGTLGAQILSGAKFIKIFGDSIEVRAKIYTMKNLSGHADQSGIVRWLAGFDKKRVKEVFVVHGEDESARFFSGFLGKELSLPAFAPEFGFTFDLLSQATITTPYTQMDDKALQAQLSLSREHLSSTTASLLELVKRLESQASASLPSERKKTRSLINRLEHFSQSLVEITDRWKDIL